jgi:transcription termination factor NusB
MALITPQLAGNWYFDGRTQNLLVQFAQSMAKSNEFENMSATQIKEAAELFLIENGATRWSAYQGKLQSLNALTPMERTTFGDYSSKLSTSIGSKHEDFDDGVRTILEEVEGADTREAYESAIRKLNSLKTQHKDWTVDIANQVRSHYDSRTKWVDIQGVPYSVEAIDKIMAGVEKDMTDIDAKIDDLTTKANEIEEISNETLGPDRLSELETLFNVNPDATPVENWFSKQDIINDWVNEWKQFREKKAQGADVPWIGNALNKGWNNLTKSERENEVRDFLDTFTDQEGVRIYLSNKPEVWDRFKENPIQEIRENPELKGFVKKLGIELPTE